MSANGDAEFLRLLKNDVDYFSLAVVRFEDLIPRVCASIQDQWRLQAQARRNFALELEILLERAEECVGAALAGEKTNRVPLKSDFLLELCTHTRGRLWIAGLIALGMSSGSECLQLDFALTIRRGCCVAIMRRPKSGRIKVLADPLASF